MRVVMIGTGYVGLVSGACFSEFGHHVTCVDVNADKINALKAGEIPIYEPGLDKIVADNTAAGRLSFTTDLKSALPGAEAVFIAVGTPSRRGDGHADLSYVFAAAEEVATSLENYAVIVTKSTVPVGTGRKVHDIIAKKRPGFEFDVASNPEFLREGAAISDFKRPDRIVVGAETDRARGVLKELYRPLFLNDTPMLVTGIETAEMIKYAANAFLAVKITFINEIADLCEKVGANVQEVARGMGLDKRIGTKFLHPGPGYGGSCFPKDTNALAQIGNDAGSPVTLVDAVIKANDSRKIRAAEKIIEACGGSVKDKTIAILGTAFKPETDDLRDAPALKIIETLLAAGAKIRFHDPVAAEGTLKLFPNIEQGADPYETVRGADALAIVTEWDRYRALDMFQVKSLLKNPIFVDLRNIYKRVEVEKHGFHYIGTGT